MWSYVLKTRGGVACISIRKKKIWDEKRCLCVLTGPTQYFNHLTPTSHFILPFQLPNADNQHLKIIFYASSFPFISSCPISPSVSLFPGPSLFFHLVVLYYVLTILQCHSASRSLSLCLNTVSMKTNVTPMSHDTVTIFQPESICHHVTRTDPLSIAEREGKREMGRKHRDSLYLKTIK